MYPSMTFGVEVDGGLAKATFIPPPRSSAATEVPILYIRYFDKSGASLLYAGESHNSHRIVSGFYSPKRADTADLPYHKYDFRTDAKFAKHFIVVYPLDGSFAGEKRIPKGRRNVLEQYVIHHGGGHRFPFNLQTPSKSYPQDIRALGNRILKDLWNQSILR